MRQKRGTIIAIAISLLVHCLFLIGFYFYFTSHFAKEPKETVIMIDLKDREWQIADIPPPAKEERPAKAKHLGMYDSKVPEETVAAETPRAPGRPKSRGGEGIEELKKRAVSSPDAAKMADVSPPKEKEARLPSTTLPEDFYPDYKRGSHTYINVLKHPDIGYFVMLKRVFKLAWDPTDVLMSGRMRGEVSRGNIKVVLGLAITGSGEISELFVINGSGIPDYDGEALRAIRVSAPFSRPPVNLLQKDGVLRVSWTFIVYM